MLINSLLTMDSIKFVKRRNKISFLFLYVIMSMPFVYPFDLMAQSDTNTVWVDQFVKANNQNLLNEPWYVFTDKLSGGGSEIKLNYRSHERYENQFLEASYFFHKQQWQWTPYASFGFKLEENQIDLSSLEGIAYDFKGCQHAFVYNTSSVKDFAFFQKTIGESNEWKTVFIPFYDLAQPFWGDKKEFSPLDVNALIWQVLGKNGDSSKLCIDNVRFLKHIDESLLTVDQKVKKLSKSIGDTEANNSVDAYNRIMTIDDQKKDLKILAEMLEYFHPTLYNFCSKFKLDSTFTSIEKEIKTNRSSRDFLELIHPVFVIIRDAHTWPEIVEKNNQIDTLFPLDVKIVSGRLYAYQNLSNKKIPEGAEIIEINGLSASYIIEKLEKKVVVDGYIETTRERNLEGWFCFYYASVYGNCTEFTIRYRYNGNEKMVSGIHGLTEKEMELKRTKKKKQPAVLSPPFYSFNFSKNKKAAIIKIGYFEPIKQGEFEKFIDSCFTAIERSKVNNLIIDLRWNIGGLRKFPIYLYSKISDHPFGYLKEQLVKESVMPNYVAYMDSTMVYEKRTDKLYSITKANIDGIGIQKNSDKPFLGNVFLLIDGQSGSSSAQFASIFHHNKRGIIIGEEPAGLYSRTSGGIVDGTTLPFSKLKIHIPMYAVILDVDDKLFVGHGVKPDHKVELDINKIVKGEDSILEYAIDLIK